MKNRKKFIVTLMGTLVAGSLTGYSVLASVQTENNTAWESIFYPQSAIDTGNAVSDSSAEELPGGNVDYSAYEQYGLIYDKESKRYTYNGDVVRFFNDTVAGASFTNFFTGTVDIEAEYDAGNKLIGIRECDADVYDRHTKKHEKFIDMFPGDVSMDMAIEAGNQTANIYTLQNYETYGISHNREDGHWYYNGQRICIFIDGGQPYVYFDDGGSIYLSLSQNSEDGTMEIREISEAGAQSLLQNNIVVGEDYAIQK